MEFNELVKIRRSVREYQKADISVDDINEIIKCALLAPSWCNFEVGRYYVALSEEAIDRVFNDLPEYNKNNTKNAAYIVSTFKTGLAGYARGEKTKYGDIWGGYDLGLQNAYLCLKASDLGYDTLIMGLRDEDKLREYFNIPEDEIILPVIAIGKRTKEANFNKRKQIDEVLVIK